MKVISPSELYLLSDALDLSNVTFTSLTSLDTNDYPLVQNSYTQMQAARYSHSSRYFMILQNLLFSSIPITSLYAQWAARQFLDELYGKSTNALINSSFVAERLVSLARQDRYDAEYSFGQEYHDIGSEIVNEIVSNTQHNSSFRVSLMAKTIAADYEKATFLSMPQIPKTFVAYTFNKLSGETDSLIFNLTLLHNNYKIIKNASIMEYQKRAAAVENKQMLLQQLFTYSTSERLDLIDAQTTEEVYYFFTSETNWVPTTFLKGDSPAEIYSMAKNTASLLSVEMKGLKNEFVLKVENYLTNSLSKSSDILTNLTAISTELQLLNEKLTINEDEVITSIAAKKSELTAKFERMQTDYTFKNWFASEMKQADDVFTQTKDDKLGLRFRKYASIAKIYSSVEFILNDPSNSYFTLTHSAQGALKSLNRTIFLAEQDKVVVDNERQQYQQMGDFLNRATPADLMTLAEIPRICDDLTSAIYSLVLVKYGYLDDLRLRYKPILETLYVYDLSLVFDDYHTMRDFEVLVQMDGYSPELALGSYLSILSFYNSLDSKIDLYTSKAITHSLVSNIQYSLIFTSPPKLDEKINFIVFVSTRNELSVGTNNRINLTNLSKCGQPLVFEGVKPNEEINLIFECEDVVARTTSEETKIIAINPSRAYLQKEIHFNVSYPLQLLEMVNVDALAYLDGKAVEYNGFVVELTRGLHTLVLNYYYQSPVETTINYSSTNAVITADVVCKNKLTVSITNFAFYLQLEDFSSRVNISITAGECTELSTLFYKCTLPYMAPADNLTLTFKYAILEIENLTTYLDNKTNKTAYAEITTYINNYTLPTNNNSKLEAEKIKAADKAISLAITQRELLFNTQSLSNQTETKIVKNLTSQKNELTSLTREQSNLQTRLNSLLTLPLEQNLSSDLLTNLSSYLNNAKDELSLGNETALAYWLSTAKDEFLRDDTSIETAEDVSIQTLELQFSRFEKLKLTLNSTLDAFRKAYTVNNTSQTPFSLAPYLSRFASCSSTVEEAKANLRIKSFSKSKAALSCIDKVELELLLLDDTVTQEKNSAYSFIALANASISKLNNFNHTILNQAVNLFENGYYLQAKQLAMDVLKEANAQLPITFSTEETEPVLKKEQSNTIIFVAFLILFILLLSLISLKKEKKELPWVVKRVRSNP